MSPKNYTTEQIIGFLRQGEVLLSQGKSMEYIYREIGVSKIRIIGGVKLMEG